MDYRKSHRAINEGWREMENARVQAKSEIRQTLQGIMADAYGMHAYDILDQIVGSGSKETRAWIQNNMEEALAYVRQFEGVSS